MVFVQLYQDSIVLLVAIRLPTKFGVGKISPFKKMLSQQNASGRRCGKNIDSFKRLDTPNLFFQFYIQVKKMKPLSLQGNDSTKIKNTKTVPDSYLILIV